MNRKFWNHLLILPLVMIASLIAGQSWAANYPLQIIQPQAGLDTKNRFYKAYPGLEYNVRLAVIGGDYPFQYSLTTAPSGMTINANTGEISWPNPTCSNCATGQAYTVTARVTDLGASMGGEGTGGSVTTVTWTITVTTTGFLFIDAVNGHSSVANGGTGTGTLANPFRTILDWYGPTQGASLYPSYFVYYRTGTYTLNGVFRYVNTPTNFTPLASGNKPMVHLEYPGESAVIDFEFANSFNAYGGCDHLYWDGFEIKNMSYATLTASGSCSHMTFRRLTMHELGSTFCGFACSSGANNQAFINTTLDGSTRGLYLTIQDNNLYNLDLGAGLKIYRSSHFLIEDNVIHHFVRSGDEAIDVKTDNQYGSIRHNIAYSVGRGIGGDGYATSSDQEFSYNNVYGVVETASHLNDNSGTSRLFLYRNTFQGPVEINSTSPGPVTAYKNVVQNASGGILCSGCYFTLDHLGTNDNLRATSGLVSPTGYLLPAYKSLGALGWELSAGGADITPPTPPTNLTVR